MNAKTRNLLIVGLALIFLLAAGPRLVSLIRLAIEQTIFVRGAYIKGYVRDAFGAAIPQTHLFWSDRITGELHECLSGGDGYFYGPTEVPTNNDLVPGVVNFHKQGYKIKAVWFELRQNYYGEYDLGVVTLDKENPIFPTVPTTALTQTYTTPGRTDTTTFTATTPTTTPPTAATTTATSTTTSTQAPIEAVDSLGTVVLVAAVAGLGIAVLWRRR